MDYHRNINSHPCETTSKKSRSNPDRYLTIYRRQKNLLTKVTRATRDQYYRTLLETSIGNSKKIWSNINCILSKKHSSINTTIKLDGIHVAEPETIANAFNYYFNGIPITLSDNINNNLTAFESYLDGQITESDNFHQTSIHEITKIIKKFKNTSSVGWHNIPTNMLKTNVMTLAPILSNLINKSLVQGLSLSH